MPDIWNFTLLLGAGFFCISLKIFLSFVLECSEVTWKQWSFQILLLSCVRQYHFSLLHCWGKTLLSTLAVGTGTVLDFCVLWVVFPLILFGGSFTAHGWFSSHICSDEYSAKDFGIPCADLWIFLSSFLLGALLCIWRSPCCPQTKFCLLDSGRPLCSASVPHSCSVA